MASNRRRGSSAARGSRLGAQGARKQAGRRSPGRHGCRHQAPQSDRTNGCPLVGFDPGPTARTMPDPGFGRIGTTLDNNLVEIVAGRLQGQGRGGTAARSDPCVRDAAVDAALVDGARVQDGASDTDAGSGAPGASGCGCLTSRGSARWPASLSLLSQHGDRNPFHRALLRERQGAARSVEEQHPGEAHPRSTVTRYPLAVDASSKRPRSSKGTPPLLRRSKSTSTPSCRPRRSK